MEILIKSVLIFVLFIDNNPQKGGVVGIQWQAWQLDTSISDGVLVESVISTLTVNSNTICLLKCFEFQNCVTIGYSQTGTCNLYSDYLTGKQTSLTFQASTLFYKTASVCNGIGYIPIGQLNSCIKIHTLRLSFDDARDMCKSEGGDIIVLSSTEKYDYVEQFLMKEVGSAAYWVGLKQTPGDILDWTWLDNTPLSFDRWYTGSNEPNVVDEECAYMQETNGPFVLFDAPCAWTLSYVCEITT